MKWFILLISILLFSCSTNKKEEENTSTENKTDTMEIIRGFIYGLWSMDSGNILLNDGYYFKPDGTVDFIASDVSGFWEMTAKDSIKIIYSSFNEEISSVSKIDSLTINRMVLKDKDGNLVFRKVPFGMNNEGIVLQGFAGKLKPGNEKEYHIDIPSTKKIALKLSSENTGLTFNIYDGNEMINSTPLREWTSIMIRSGKYRVTVSNSENNPDKKEAAFDLKVIGY